MRLTPRIVCGATTLTLLVGAATPAAAADPASAPAAWADDFQGTAPQPGPRSLPLVSVDLSLGVAAQHEPGDGDGYTTLGLSVLHRPSWLTVGGNLAVAQALSFDGTPSHTQIFLGALGGATLALADWFGVETLAEAGLHLKGSGDVRDRPSETDVIQEENATTLPYAGLRVTPAFTLGALRLGPWIHARADLGRTTAHTTGPGGEQRDRDVGMTELGFGLFVGLAMAK